MRSNRYFVTTNKRAGLFMETTSLDILVTEMKEDIICMVSSAFDNLKQNFIDNHLEQSIMEELIEFTTNTFNKEMKDLKKKVNQLEKLSEN
jgi:hypothetical protein